MANYYKDNDDLRFYVEKGLDWGPLVEAVEQGYRFEEGPRNLAEALEGYRDLLEMWGEFVGEEVAPRAEAFDRVHPKLEDGEAVCAPEWDEVFEMIKSLELHGMSLPRELDGMNLPLTLYFINAEILGRADVSAMSHHSFHGGIAMALLFYSLMEGTTEWSRESGRLIRTRFGDAVREIARGEAWGCMDITEPDAGSDMAALRTRAVLDDEGVWRLTGQKIFITSGYGKHHIVIARTEESTGAGPMGGLDGLSLLWVKAYDDNPDGTRTRYATVDRLEDKLGHHGSVTAAITFENTPGELIGERGEGFKQMLLLMNNARIGVAAESLGICEAAWRMARDYAAERRSMGKTIDRHEMIAEYLEQMETDIQGIRALMMHACWHEELGQRLTVAQRYLMEPDSLEARRMQKRIDRLKWSAREVTPLVKYLASEKSVEHSRMCIQIHGGVGYTTEYGGERLLRDAMVMPIYEGTSQIQSLMVMKDTLGRVMKNPQGFVTRATRARWRAMSARDPLERRVAKLEMGVNEVVQLMIRRTATDKLKGLSNVPMGEWSDQFFKNWDPKRDFAFAMLHAERLTKMKIDAKVAEILLDQAQRFDERRDVLERWLERAEPRSRFLADEIATTGDRLLAKLGGDEAAEEAAG
jgi:alkylation response protein AidB-like acyl-CoA dehydrogenase